MGYEYERKLFGYLDNLKNYMASRPLILGGVKSSGGGSGGPPGGFIGFLPQSRVAYDTTEMQAMGGGDSLVDNLNHIRSRLGIMEFALGIADLGPSSLVFHPSLSLHDYYIETGYDMLPVDSHGRKPYKVTYYLPTTPEYMNSWTVDSPYVEGPTPWTEEGLSVSFITENLQIFKIAGGTWELFVSYKGSVVVDGIHSAYTGDPVILYPRIIKRTDSPELDELLYNADTPITLTCDNTYRTEHIYIDLPDEVFGYGDRILFVFNINRSDLSDGLNVDLVSRKISGESDYPLYFSTPTAYYTNIVNATGLTVYDNSIIVGSGINAIDFISRNLHITVSDKTVTISGFDVGGSGGVSGPFSSTDNHLVRWDGTNGDTLQDSLISASDSGSIDIPVGQTYNIDGSPHTHTIPKLDDLNPPDDNTDLNVSTTAHGLTPKLPNDVNKYLNGLGNWVVVSGGAGHIVAKNGTTYPNRGKLNFSGAPVTITDSPGTDSTNITITEQQLAGHIIQDEGHNGYTQRTALRFAGTGVSVSDDPANEDTLITIDSAGGHIITSSGIIFPTRSKLEFNPARFSVLDDELNDRTVVSEVEETAGLHIVASGGTMSTIILGGFEYNVHVFTEGGTFYAPSGLYSVDVMIVAGGGGGSAGGGGAGGVHVQDGIAVTPTTTVTIGGGGAGKAPYDTWGDNGANSSFGSVVAYGGGGGGTATGDDKNGREGGSGGGGAYDGADVLWIGGAPHVVGEGNCGGSNNQIHDAPYPAGGGGGAGSVGQDAPNIDHGGSGGNGVSFSSMIGLVDYFAGGGGGGLYSGGTGGLGGSGGGGNGHGTDNGENGSPNTGGGGGGGGNGYTGGSGGTGIVIIRYINTTSGGTHIPWTNITSVPSSFPPSSHTHVPSDVVGTSIIESDYRLSDARTPTSHTHSASDVTGTAVLTDDSRLSDPRTPTAHTHVMADITDLVKITVSTNAPTSPNVGDLWVDTN